MRLPDDWALPRDERLSVELSCLRMMLENSSLTCKDFQLARHYLDNMRKLLEMPANAGDVIEGAE